MEDYIVWAICVSLCFAILIGAGIYSLIELNKKASICESKFNGVSLNAEPNKCYINDSLYEINKLSDGTYVKILVVRK